MAKMLQKNNYGWLPDIPDKRDYLYRTIKPRLKLPKIADITRYCSTIENQGTLGSCTANALAGNIEFLDNRWDGEYTDASRLFIYFNERVIIGSQDYDSGASLRDGIKTLKNIGYCWEKDWPYKIKLFDQKPPESCYKEALEHLIVSYHRISGLNEMLICLSEGYPFVFGFTVYESFEDDQVSRSGIVNMPDKDERALGGHAVMAVGYNQKEKRFLVRNSWGVKWGRKGYFTMPFEYLETLAADFWTIRK